MVKISGGKKKKRSAKKKRELGRPASETIVGETRVKAVRVRSGNVKRRLFRVKEANIRLDNGEMRKTEIQNVLDNPANKDYARRRVMTKGAIIQTEFGRARITSRPGQEGVVNAVVIPE